MDRTKQVNILKGLGLSQTGDAFERTWKILKKEFPQPTYTQPVKQAPLLQSSSSTVIGNGATDITRDILESQSEPECGEDRVTTTNFQMGQAVVTRFLQLAKPFKRMKEPKEYMGYLLGVEEETQGVDVLIVTRLFVPRQAATGSACWEVDEKSAETLTKVMEANKEQVVGWIHMHPDFDAYLSSTDQHMQFSLQNSEPRAVAIVTDKHDTPHYYRLTDAGMAANHDCTFKPWHEPHPHDSSDGPLFTEVEITKLFRGKRARIKVHDVASVESGSWDNTLSIVQDVIVDQVQTPLKKVSRNSIVKEREERVAQYEKELRDKKKKNK